MYLQLGFSTSYDYPARDDPSARRKYDETLIETQEGTISWVEINYKW